MTDWGQGYVTDLGYTFGFYRELSPAYLQFVSRLKGQRPPCLDDGFDYCELGCGQGFGTVLLAASNPKGRFWGFDFNPGHIVHAENLAKSAGISNVSFAERSFQELLEPEAGGLPEFDFIVLHGIYSWISNQNREAIRAFIARHLKPGGLVYVSYNCQPGWATTAPVQWLIRELGTQLAGRRDLGIRSAIDLAQKLSRGDLGFFQANPNAAKHLERMREKDPVYLVHEYMNDSWIAPYHADVAREMSEAKLTFLGSATLPENFESLVSNDALQAASAGIDDPALLQTLQDFFLNQGFRRDIYIRGGSPLTATQKRDQVLAIRFALTTTRQAVSLEFSGPRGKMRGKPEIYEPVLDALDRRPHNGAELLSVPGVQGVEIGVLLQCLAMLTSSGQAHPMLDGPVETAPACRFNAIVAQRSVEGLGYAHFAAPALGSGVLMGGFMGAAVYSLSNRAEGHTMSPGDLMPRVWEMMRDAGRVLQKDGEPIRGDEENKRELLQRLHALCSQKVPVWADLGVMSQLDSV